MIFRPLQEHEDIDLDRGVPLKSNFEVTFRTIHVAVVFCFELKKSYKSN